MLKLRLRCARVKVDKRYKVTSGGPQTCSVAIFGHNFVFFDVSSLVEALTVLNRSCVRLPSSFEQVSEHKTKGLGFKSHVSIMKFAFGKLII